MTTRTFRRREHIPLEAGIFWQIETGTVRAFTSAGDGTAISLGFWGTGGIVGQRLSCIQPYQIECLTDVNIRSLVLSEGWSLNQVMLSHIHQMQALLRIRSGQIQQWLRHFLAWLADQFGRETDQGQLIELRLTHQDIADVVGTTRVTITRLLQQLEREGAFHWVKGHYILLHCR